MVSAADVLFRPAEALVGHVLPRVEHLQASEVGELNEVALNAYVQAYADEQGSLTAAASRFLLLGRADAAVACWRHLLELRALDIGEQLQFADALFAAGEVDAAANQIEVVLDASAEPHSSLICHAAGYIQAANRTDRALALLLSHLDTHGRDAPLLTQIAGTYQGTGDFENAERFGRRAVAADPSSRHAHHVLTQILIQAKRFDEAEAMLDADCLADDPYTLYLRADIARSKLDFDGAYHWIDQALAAEPTMFAALHLKAFLLGLERKWPEAIAAYHDTLGVAPADEGVQRGLMFAYIEDRDFDAARPICARLIGARPDDKDLQFAAKVIAEHALGLGAASMRDFDPDDFSRFGKPPAVRKIERGRGISRAILLQFNIIMALIAREARTRFGKSSFGYMWVIFEPFAHIGIMIMLVSVIGHGKGPPIGDSFSIFYFTGVVPYHLFSHSLSHMTHAVPENRPMLNLPAVHVSDVLIARAILELVTEFCVAAIILFVLYCFNINIMPLNFLGVLTGFILVWLAGVGCGLISSVIALYFKGWPKIVGALNSLLYFSSGTFFIPRMMPLWIRDILAWNPVLQAIEQIRWNYFVEPWPYWLDIQYLTLFALISLAIGFAGVRIFAHELMVSE